MLLCGYFYIIYIFIILHCPLSGPDFTYISLLIIPCIIYYVTNKETLNLEPWHNKGYLLSSMVLSRTFNIDGTFQMHKRFFIEEKDSKKKLKNYSLKSSLMNPK